MVVNPAAENTDSLQAAAQQSGAAVVLDQRWASNPAVPGAEDAVRSMAGRAALLDTVATAPVGTDSGELFADHLAAVVRLAGPLANLRHLRRGPHGYTTTAVLANGAPVAIQGVVSNARPAALDFRLLTDDGGVSVTLPEPAGCVAGDGQSHRTARRASSSHDLRICSPRHVAPAQGTPRCRLQLLRSAPLRGAHGIHHSPFLNTELYNKQHYQPFSTHCPTQS